jgi:hypothetical protein
MFKVHYRYRETIYHISVLQGRVGEDQTSVTIDGVLQHDRAVPLIDDRQEHLVKVMIQRGK